MKKIFLYLLIVLSVALILSGCKNDSLHAFESGYSTNKISKSDKKEIDKVLSLSNKELFFDLVSSFNKGRDSGCGIRGWDKTNNFKYNDALCAKRYEKRHKISDGNCRITAFLLMQDKLEIENLRKEDSGSYLMFDMDVIENNKKYKKVKDEKDKFISLYNEIDVSSVDKASLKDVFPNKWKKAGIHIDEGNSSLISLVMYDEDSNLLFVGHTGVLIETDNKMIFIEKIAFLQPYQITVVNSLDELIEVFRLRPTYFGDSIGPFVYRNDKLIYSY